MSDDQSDTTLPPPIGPCAECGVEIEYGEGYTVTKDLRRRHSSCTEEHHTTETTREWPCTECGGDAMLAYTAGKRPGSDWGGKVKRGERLCTSCFRKRGGEPFFGPSRIGRDVNKR